MNILRDCGGNKNGDATNCHTREIESEQKVRYTIELREHRRVVYIQIRLLPAQETRVKHSFFFVFIRTLLNNKYVTEMS